MPLLFLFASFSPSYSRTILQLSISSTKTWGWPISQAPILALKSEFEAKRGHKGHSHIESLSTFILPSSCSRPGQELLPPRATLPVFELTTITSYFVGLLIVVKTHCLCFCSKSEIGCVNNHRHKTNKSPYSCEVDRQIFTSPIYGEVDWQICLSFCRRADLPSLRISLYYEDLEEEDH